MSDATFLSSFVSALNRDAFLREFSFSKTVFVPPGGTQVEVADHVVRLGGLLLLFQLKEREAGATGDLAAWFERKVVGKATKQIRETVRLLSAGMPVIVPNDHGDSFDVALRTDDEVHRLVLFKSGETRTPLPYPRFHPSETVGFIHILDALDFQGVLNLLVTPAEIAEYLTWRALILTRDAAASAVSEAGLAGQFLLQEFDVVAEERFARALEALQPGVEAFAGLLRMLAQFREHIDTTAEDPETRYYPILGLFAQMYRSELAAVQERVSLALETVRDDQFQLPWRSVSPRLKCGVLVVPVAAENAAARRSGLQSLSLLSKYEQRVTKQIGIAITRQLDGYLIDWLYTDDPWVYDPRAEELLRENYPFRPMHSERRDRYFFSTDALNAAGLLRR